jgi:hypothetical protein
MSAPAKPNMADAARHEPLPEEPQIDPVDDALWHLQGEARRVAQLVARHGLDAAQRRELQRALAVLRTAADWQPARLHETEPAL